MKPLSNVARVVCIALVCLGVVGPAALGEPNLVHNGTFALEPVDMRVRYHPELPAGDRPNVIPNSSFECGAAGWGSYSPQLTSWSGNIFRQLGAIDETTAAHGKQSLRVQVDKRTCPVFHWDYFDASVEPAHTVLAAHHGWARVRYYEILTEPIYTTYAVPQRFGYGMRDYLRHLQDAHRVIKEEQPGARVVGGIGSWVDGQWVGEFIKAGGLRWCDVMDIHLYPVTVPPETYQPDLEQCLQTMRSHGGVKPMWLTEFGCYADDDPPTTPGAIGDSAMSRANWPSERAASEAMVKTAAVFLSHGVEKIFYHAGTCGAINGSSGGGIFFEYGGVPRKMYAAQSVLAGLLGPAPKPVPLAAAADTLRAYAFNTGTGVVAVVWAADGKEHRFRLAAGVVAKNIMGNALPRAAVSASDTPLYMAAEKVDAVEVTLRSPE